MTPNQTLWLITPLAVASASYTVTRAGVFEPVRSAVEEKNRKIGELLRCPYCLAHWLTFAAGAGIGEPFWGPWYIGWPLSVFAVVMVVSLLHHILLRTYQPLTAEEFRIMQTR